MERITGYDDLVDRCCPAVCGDLPDISDRAKSDVPLPGGAGLVGNKIPPAVGVLAVIPVPEQGVEGLVRLLRIGPSAGTVYLRLCTHAPALDLDGTLPAVVKEEGGRKPQVLSAVRPGLQLIDRLPVIVSVPVHPVRRG